MFNVKLSGSARMFAHLGKVGEYLNIPMAQRYVVARLKSGFQAKPLQCNQPKIGYCCKYRLNKSLKATTVSANHQRNAKGVFR